MEAIYTEIRIAIHAVWRMRWLALAIAWGLCALGWIMVMRIPASFESTARISVQVKNLIGDGNDVQAGIERVRQSLTSTEILKRVVRNVSNGERPLTSTESLSLIGALRGGITITAQSENLMEIKTRISLKDVSDRQTAFIARSVTQQLIDIFVSENLIGNRTDTAEALAFLDNELARRSKELSEADRRRVVDAQETMGSIPGVGTLEQRMDQARGELANVDSGLMTAQSSLASMNGQIAATPTSIPAAVANGAPTLDQRIGMLEGQLSEATAKGWTDKHPDVIAIRAQLAQLHADQARGGGKADGPMAPNPVYVSLRSMQAERQGNVAALAARKSELESIIATINQRQLSAPQQAASQAQLDRDYGVLREQYNKLLQDREAAKLKADATSKTDGVRFRVIDQPSMPTSPAAPNRPMLLTGVMILAMIVGAGIAFAKSQLENVFTTTQQLARASGLPVLGSISEVITPELRVTRRKQLIYFSSAAAALPSAYILLLLVEFVKRIMVS